MKIEHSVLRLNEVTTRTGRSRSSIYNDMQQGKFPHPIRLGERAVGWLESDISSWLEARIAASRPTQNAEEGGINA